MPSPSMLTGSAVRSRSLALFAARVLGVISLAQCWALPALAAPGATPPAPTQAAAIEPASAKTSLDVAYPEGASGDSEVELDLWIGKDGVVTQADVLRGEEPFAAQAKQTALRWLFQPARRGGREVAVHTRVTVVFKEPALQSQPAPETPPNAASRAAPLGSAATSAPPSSRSAVARPAAAEAPVEVEVHGVRSSAASVTFTREEVRELPGAFGDPFRAVEIMPGVTPTSSGHPYFYVRGAPPGNVGYYFDDIPLPVLYHAVNGPAVLQPALIDSVTLYPGAYSARYGRYAGAVVAGRLAPPEFKLRGEASVRLFDAGAMLEAPFAEGRGSVTAGGRYSYSGALVSHLSSDVTFGYWDYQTRVAYKANKSTLSLLALGAHDFLSLDKSEGPTTILDTTFHRVDLRYDYALDERTAARVAFTYGRDEGQGQEQGLHLHADQFRVRTTLSRQLSEGASLRVGADAELDAFGYSTSPALDAAALDDFLARGGRHRLGVAGAWTELTARVSDRVTLMPGLRFDVYHERDETKVSVEPRITARYQISKHVVITNSAGLARQPASRQVPTPGYRPRLQGPLQTGIQTGGGLELELPSAVLASVSVFQTVLLDGVDFDGTEGLAQNARVDAEDTRSRGHSVGAEFVVSRSLTQRLGGFLSYTLSRAERKVGNVEGPSGFDRTHVVSGALGYDFGRGWRTAVRGTFYTGVPVRVGISSVARKPPRTPPFWRIDTRLEKRWRLARGASIAFVLEVLNATFKDEVVSSSCYAYGCREERIGPITLPSLGVEGAF
jgi:hypothetical protein